MIFSRSSYSGVQFSSRLILSASATRIQRDRQLAGLIHCGSRIRRPVTCSHHIDDLFYGVADAVSQVIGAAMGAIQKGLEGQQVSPGQIR